MPNNERHVKLSIKRFGKEHEELIVMVNSWMDAPVRRLKRQHRRSRHTTQTVFDACALYGNLSKDKIAEKNRIVIHWTPKNKLIAQIVLHHLILDGLILPKNEEKILQNLTKEPWVYTLFFRNACK